MEKNRLFTAMCLSAAILLMGGCTQNEPTDMDGTVQDLPEGKYPLQIASVSLTAESSAEPWGANAPQTRVSEKTDGNSSQWDGGEEITVQLSGTMADNTPYTAEGKYILGNDKTTLSPVSGKELYWRSTSAGTVTAWYSNPDYTSGNTVNLSNQSNGLAYVLKAEASNVTYNTPFSLSFKHQQLAKIRVELTGTADMEEGTVQVKGYTKGTISNGSVTGSDEGWITMQRISYSDGTVGYEANVISGFDLHQDAFQVTPINSIATSLNLDQSVQVTNGQICKITLTVNKKGTNTIKLAEQGDVYTVLQGASVIIDGEEKKLSKRILISSGARVMLKNVLLNASDGNNTIEVQGTATLVLSGKNEITGSENKCPLTVTNGTLTIDGTINDQLKLTGYGSSGGCLGLSMASLIINGGNIVADGSNTEGAGIGSYWAGEQEKCGDITINGGIIKASGGGGSAGIGSGYQCRCGNIIITGGYITAIGGGGDWGGAGIGSGSTTGVCGNITISGKNTLVTATAGNGSCDDIGIGEYGQCGTVTITDATVIATNEKIHGH